MWLISYAVNSIKIHKYLRLDKRADSDNRYAHRTLLNGKHSAKITKTDDLETSKEAAPRFYFKVDARIQNKLKSVIIVHILNCVFKAQRAEFGHKLFFYDAARTLYSLSLDNRNEMIFKHSSK